MSARPKSLWILAILLSTILFASAPGAQAQLGAAVTNWPPAPFTPASAVQAGMHVMSDVTFPIAFVGITPCRVVDTRQPTGPFGGPPIAPGSPRSFNIPAGPCSGIPQNFNTQAYSLNITAVNPTATGFLKVFPQGGSSPVVSTVNFVAGQTIANAAIVAAGGSGGITIAASATTDVLVDINGYYSDSPNSQSSYFELVHNSTTALMFLENSSASCTGGNICGLQVDVLSGTALAGIATAASGAAHGVYGSTDSTDSNTAGVFGSAGQITDSRLFSPAGVRGESSEVGVLGVADSIGAVGEVLDSSGNLVAFGDLGKGGANVYGVFSGGDFGGSGAKYFVEPHPTDASKVIRYVSLEGPESGTYFRGSGQVIGGQAVIEVPESFRMVTDTEGLTVQLTPMGPAADLYVVRKGLDQILVQASKDVAFDYLVNGVRRAFKDHQAISDGQEFMPQSPSEGMPSYLTAEAKSRLITNGTYNADGTVNMGTAERLGWTKVWADRDVAAQTAAEKAKAARQAVDH